MPPNGVPPPYGGGYGLPYSVDGNQYPNHPGMHQGGFMPRRPGPRHMVNMNLGNQGYNPAGVGDMNQPHGFPMRGPGGYNMSYPHGGQHLLNNGGMLPNQGKVMNLGRFRGD